MFAEETVTVTNFVLTHAMKQLANSRQIIYRYLLVDPSTGESKIMSQALMTNSRLIPNANRLVAMTQSNPVDVTAYYTEDVDGFVDLLAIKPNN